MTQIDDDDPRPHRIEPAGEAAHIRWFSFDGPDDPDNGLALCSLSHRLFDHGAVDLNRPTIGYAIGGPASRHTSPHGP